jgi:hypothetical protein
MKYYIDWDKGYNGYAVAVYLEPSQRDIIISNFWATQGRTVDKLSNNISWLCWKALEEWDYKNGEIYMIQCSEIGNGNAGIVVIATITNSGKSFNFYAKAFP